MKTCVSVTILFLFSAGAVLTAFAEGQDSPAQTEKSVKLTFLHANDFHGRYYPIPLSPGNATSQSGDPGGPWYSFDREGVAGGFEYITGFVKELRRQRGEQNVIVTHAGDAFSDDLLGNLTEGRAVIHLMNSVGFQFMALGNHDFDYGLERTEELQQIADFPMRGANVIDRRTGEPLFGDPTLVIEIQGFRIGLLALGYHNTAETSSPQNTRDLEFTNGIEAARLLVPELKKNSDILVVVSHQGFEIDRILAREVDGIDLILGGHSHDMISEIDKIGGTWLIHSFSDAVILTEVNLDIEYGKITGISPRNHILWNDRYEPDEEMRKRIEKMRAPYREYLEEVIATADTRIGRQYKSESPFDKMVGNILLEETRAQLTMLPGIGYGVSLQKGPNTREALYTLLPHPSELVTLELTGSQILEILEQSAVNQNPADPMDTVGGLIQTAGMRWKVDLTRPPGKRISEVYIGGVCIEAEKKYRVATHNGMLKGIHRYNTFADGENIRETNRKIVEIVEAYMKNQEIISPPALGDITLITKSGERIESTEK
jgi:5'-nucleotidase / UDP-sugar diphosphatase